MIFQPKFMEGSGSFDDHFLALFAVFRDDPINNPTECRIYPVLTTKPIIPHAQISKHIPLIGV